MNSETSPISGNVDNNKPAISDTEFKVLVEMIGPDDPAVLLDLLDTYLVESAGLIASIRDGVDSGDFTSALRPAHSLKSSSASIGALHLSKYCADLESYLRDSLPALDVPLQVELIEYEFSRVHTALEIEMTRLKS
jgi:HPt (histidine-containing phosphotransfer) domain-containing protein